MPNSTLSRRTALDKTNHRSMSRVAGTVGARYGTDSSTSCKHHKLYFLSKF